MRSDSESDEPDSAHTCEEEKRENEKLNAKMYDTAFDDFVMTRLVQ